MPITQAFVAKPGEARCAGPLDIFGDLIWVKLAAADSDGGVSIIEVVTPPQVGPPLHRRSREDEWFHVLEGEFLIEVDREQMTAGPGCSAFAPKGTAHTFQNISPSPGRMIVVAQPAGMDIFFTELGAALKEMREPDMPVLLSIFEKHGIEFLGPPLAARDSTATVRESAVANPARRAGSSSGLPRSLPVRPAQHC